MGKTKIIPKSESEKPSLFYDYNWILSKNRLFSWVMGLRGGGKTYGATKLAIDNFLKKGEKTIWVRRYGVEMDGQFFTEFFTDMYDLYPDYEFQIRRIGNGNANAYIREKREDGKGEWREFMFFMALSLALKHKSTNLNEYTMIFCDEWVIDEKASNLSYINGWDEPFIFYEFVESVIRLRDNVRIIFASNALTSINPYFSDWGIEVPSDAEWVMTDDVCVHNYTNTLYKEKKLETRWGRFLDGTRYGAYNMDNEYFKDEEGFVCEKGENAKWFCNIILYKDKYGVWSDPDRNVLWIGDPEPNGKRNYCFLTEDMKPNYYQIDHAMGVDEMNLGRELVKAWKNGYLYFRDYETQTKTLDLIGLLKKRK